MRKISGAAWRKQEVFVKPLFGVAKTQWEELLGELRLSEEDVLPWLRADPSATRWRITEWVRGNCWRCYVPEPVLRALAIDVDEEVSSQRPGNYGRQWARASSARAQYGMGRERAAL